MPRSRKQTRPRTEATRDGQAKPAAAATVRFAVVGLGHIAQAAVLPAFAHAKKHCTLEALVTDDPVKARTLARKYRVPSVYSYDDYDACLERVDAVYIALPNSMHSEYTVRAANAGVHVLCEKPMAVTRDECDAMIRACRDAGVKAMIAYRLHYEACSIEVGRIARSSELGEVRAFHSAFTMDVKPGNIRLDAALGGGPLYDIGIYVINAARMVFAAEPQEVAAFSVRGRDRRFDEVDEMTGAVLRYSGGRLATFVTSFGATDVSMYEVIGTKGKLRVEPAFEYAEGLAFEKTIGKRKTRRTFAKRDQFAPELIDFAKCIAQDRDPEPSLEEGRNDVEIIEALLQSASTGKAVSLDLAQDATAPPTRVITKPPVKKVREVRAQSPSR